MASNMEDNNDGPHSE